MTMATGAAGRGRGQLGDALEAVARQHRVHHLEVDGAQALHQRRGTLTARALSLCACIARAPSGTDQASGAAAATSGCACSVSSPDSPVRMR